MIPALSGQSIILTHRTSYRSYGKLARLHWGLPRSLYRRVVLPCPVAVVGDHALPLPAVNRVSSGFRVNS